MVNKILKKNRKNTLVIVCTHGDEQIGEHAIKSLRNQKIDFAFDVEIGNPQALKKGVRFIDVDQNRIAPGNLTSSLYEERRVAELLQKAINYDYVIDIHGTKSNSGIFIIIPKLTNDNIIFAMQLPIKKIVIWENVSKKKKYGPITKFVKNGIGIEAGPKNNKKVLTQLTNILKKINSNIKNIKSNLTKKEIKTIAKYKEFYRVYGSLSPDEILNKNKKMFNFIKYKNGKEYFYPLLPREYKGKIFYKTQRISCEEILNMRR